jgi:hypothetical protein
VHLKRTLNLFSTYKPEMVSNAFIVTEFKDPINVESEEFIVIEELSKLNHCVPVGIADQTISFEIPRGLVTIVGSASVRGEPI